MAWSIIATTVALFTAGVMCLPMDVPATDLLPPKMLREPATDLLPAEKENGPVAKWMPTDNGPTTDLMPSPLPEGMNEKKLPAMLFVINVFAVKNSTAEDSNDVLHSDVIEEVPSEVAVPLALFLLVLEDENENHPVSLDDVARDLEKEGFAVEKIVKNGETGLVKVDLDTFESTVRIPQGNNNVIEHETDIKDSGKLTSVRRKRHICLHCKLDELKQKIHNKHSGGCNTCGGGGGGGYYAQPVYQPVQPVYQPVVHQPVYQPPPQQNYYPQQGCSTCNGGGGYGNGGGNAYAQASAQASASSSSGGYGYGR
ncbi:uncharacterized protein LOC131668870 [Phymastichus coffea]|uniref:uncharacterized protein LOC131668870 n=1 Tax=Phymastichus coffea TaxID=108790 RepID=UPI00273BE595|nr:uncharacterized protein LOC131668870 [Phymastichus coffea]